MKQNENKENFYHLKNSFDILAFSSNVRLLRKELLEIINSEDLGVNKA
jgi:hypothetical protein